MAWTADDYKWLRFDIGVDATDLPDPEADAILDRAAGDYPNNLRKAKVHARVLALQNLRAQAATLTKYTQNDTQEDMSVIFDNYDKMIAEWTAQRDGLPDEETGTGRRPSMFVVAHGYRGR